MSQISATIVRPWYTASGSNDGTCVETQFWSDGMVQVRNSKDPNGPQLTVTPADWAAFITDAKGGTFDPVV